MARIRSDKPEAYQSETLAEVSVSAERTFKGMATLADDRGRLADKPAQINGELWSMRGGHTKDDLEAELKEMTGVDLICRYTGCDGKKYLHLVSWDQHQKIDHPGKSRLPRCPDHRAPDPKIDYCGLHKGECDQRDDSLPISVSDFSPHWNRPRKDRPSVAAEGKPYRKRAIPSAERRRLATRYGGEPGSSVSVACHYCGAPGSIMWGSDYPCWPIFTLEMDHVVPEFHGGPSVAENLVFACTGCNRSKGSRL